MGVQTPSTKRGATHEKNSKDDMDRPLIADETKEFTPPTPSNDKRNNKHKTKIIPGCIGNSKNNGNNSKMSPSSPHASSSSSKSSIPLPPTTMTTTTTATTIPAQIQYHINILYVLNACLTLLFASAVLVSYLQITSLKKELLHHKTITSQLVLQFKTNTPHPNSRQSYQNTFDSAKNKFSPYHKDYFKFQREWDSGTHSSRQDQDEGSKFRNENSGRRRKRAIKVTGGKPERDATISNLHSRMEQGDDWLWMSSFTRVPIAYLKSYCREAQLYCAAGAKTGAPGPKGEQGDIGIRGIPGMKGDKGEMGDKGEPIDPSSAVAQNLANGRGVRGPPGPKGAPGVPGVPGTPGEQGRIGPRGERGQDGMDGTQGPRGEKGVSGKRGLLGFPGHKGDQGPPGIRGPKGESGQPGVTGGEGPKGDRGYKGSKGELGHSGMPGVPGMKGLMGHMGPTGPRGYPGPRGPTGHCEVQCLTTKRPATESTTPVPKPFPPRNKECSMKEIGKPVYLRESKVRIGAFMMDSSPVDDTTRGKVWMTLGLTGSTIIEYASFTDFTRDKSSEEISLQGIPYFGTGHIAYKGCIYYQQNNTNLIVRYNIAAGQSPTMRNIPDASHTRSDGYLYQSRKAFFHFNADSNGLWVVYVNKNSGKLNVALLDSNHLDIIKSVEISVDKGTKGNAFIACGKLYTISSYKVGRAKIDTEHDMWTGKSRAMNLQFLNPYRSTKMVSFQHGRKEFFTWDRNYQLSVPVLLTR